MAVVLPPLPVAPAATRVFGERLDVLHARDQFLVPRLVDECVGALLQDLRARQASPRTPAGEPGSRGLFSACRRCPDHRRLASGGVSEVTAAPWIGVDELLAFRVDEGEPAATVVNHLIQTPAAALTDSRGSGGRAKSDVSACELVALLRRWAQALPESAAGGDGGGKLLSAEKASERLWFRCECLRMVELPYVVNQLCL